MKSKSLHSSVDEQARVEIRVFLEAINSYAARFASEPEITFEQHRESLMAVASAPPGGEIQGLSTGN
jgi:hypothetical protein